MKRLLTLSAAALMTGAFAFSTWAQDSTTAPAAKPAVKSPAAKAAASASKAIKSAKKDSTSAKPASGKPATAAKASGGTDTLEIVGRIIEIPGTFPPNDLYNYVYVMKYRVMKVIKGKYDGKEILVGVYNPLIARAQIKDKMAKFVGGDVQKFENGAIHQLLLISPINSVWKDAMEDEYFDSDMTKYYALKTSIAKQ